MTTPPHLRIIEALGPVPPDQAVAILGEALACAFAARSVGEGEGEISAFNRWYSDAYRLLLRMERERRAIAEGRR